MQRNFLKRGDAEIYYEVSGTGPALIFAHGLGGNHLSWQQQVPNFSTHYTCIAFAHRGFAPSRLHGAAPEPAEFADDLAALVAHLRLDEVRLVAQSMGGWTCLEYALREPARVKALVLACTTGVADPARLPGVDAGAIASWTENSGKEIARLGSAGIHPACGERMAREQPGLHHLYRQIDLLNADLDKDALRRKLYALRTTGPERVAGLKVPVLCISGAEDVVMPPAGVRALAAAFPSGSFEQHEAAGHSVYFERAAWFNERVAAFLGAGQPGVEPRDHSGTGM
jgi:3-oxoadipate enol-lactonase